MLYPERSDLEIFIRVITNDKYTISTYLPKISTDWYDVVCDCLDYVRTTSLYTQSLSIHDCAARLLYKIAKRHELADGNKRSAVITVYLFYMLNDYMVVEPENLKEEARRAARSRGRKNEDLLRQRISDVLSRVTLFIPPSSKKT